MIKIKLVVFIFSVITFQFCTQKKSESKLNDISNLPSENFKTFTSDGAWCWFSDPRAVYYEGKYKRTYAGWVDSSGNITIGYYDHDLKEIKTKILEANFQKDDHDNPALLFLPDGRLMVFFTKHAEAYPILQYKMNNAEDISSWNKQELFLNDMDKYSDFTNTTTYANPVMLSGEANKIYLFWRGVDNKPCVSFSEDLGATWSKGRIFILPERIYNMRRPYLKVSSNGIDKIVFAFTDGHPRKENENSIYYMYYKDGKFFNSENKAIGIFGAEPIVPRRASVVYDATITKSKSWIWDISVDENDNPVIAYVKFPDDQNHIYCYAKLNGNKWINNELTNSGKWFPQTPEAKIEPEPNYSGGIYIDHENTNIVY
ncbi:MAG: BNR repeat-containing protein, partial [Ignavibacteriae bacterium]|nr:BNR repeat-containing protein [Ignavibacteriota bacterium]